MSTYKFKVIGEKKSCTISCNLNVFSDNITEIIKYASELGGFNEKTNVIRFSSDEAAKKMIDKLWSLT